jgi:hypothetical protein
MNRGLWKPALSLVVLLVLTSVITLLCRGNSSSAQSPESAAADEPAAKPVDVPKPVTPPKPVEPAKPAPASQPTTAPQAVEPSKVAATPKASAEAGNAAERRLLLETVGALIAAHCWQTYFNIGLLADGRAKGIYNDKDANKVLDSILSIIGTVDRKLTALDKLALDKEDLTSLAQMRELSVLLRRQAEDLQSLWDNGREEDAARYESSRKDAWAGISKLLGVGR